MDSFKSIKSLPMGSVPPSLHFPKSMGKGTHKVEIRGWVRNLWIAVCTFLIVLFTCIMLLGDVCILFAMLSEV